MSEETTFTTTKFVETTKRHFEEKQKLVAKRNAISDRFNQARRFFESISRQGAEAQARDVNEGIKQLLSLIDTLNQVEKEIKDIDVVLIANLEMFLGNYVMYLETADAVDDQGKERKGQKIFMVPTLSDDEVMQITPDDIYTLKVLKQALSVSSVRVIRK